MQNHSAKDKSLSNSIAHDIATQIITGELNPGDKLIEKEYADIYGTSRAPVREAVYLLTRDGLVERIPKKGAIVKSYSNVDIFDLLEIRNMLELMAIQRIRIQSPNEIIIQEMRNNIKQMTKDTAIYTYTKLNRSFHTCIVKMSGSKPILETYSRLGWPLFRIQNISFAQQGNIIKSIKEHERILELIIKQELAELENLLSKHNNHVITSIQKILGS